jgi:hypothetical protein
MLTNRAPGTTFGDVTYGNLRCACGAVHLVFTSKKAYPGQERDELSFACQRCAQHQLVLDVYDGGYYEVHLKDDLPANRVPYLPASSSWQVSQLDYPAARRARPPRLTWKHGFLFFWSLLFVALMVWLGRR